MRATSSMAHLDPGAAARYARGNVTPEELARMREHLEACGECRARVAQRPEEADAVTVSEGARAAPAPAPAPAPPPVAAGEPALTRGDTIGRYLVVDQLGQGGMGVVYGAYDPELNRKVAIKLLRPGKAKSGGADGQARLLREAQAMARVSHPNVISVFDVGTLGDRVFVAMEQVSGPTLKQWVRSAPRGWRELLALFVQAGRGLEAAHAAGLVHRDFKPENVLVGADGRAYVTDFGLARLAGSDEPQARAAPAAGDPDEGPKRLNTPLTQDGLVLGTPQYMAPEQHLGLPPDARSDQFSFCAALYWALYRRRPFDPQKLAQAATDADAELPTQPVKPERTSGARLSRIHLTGRGVIQDPPREVKVPAHVRRAILRGLALRPEERFASMHELLAVLTRDPFVRHRRWALAASAVLAISVTVLAYQQGRARQDRLCSGAETRLATVWGEAVRADLERAFLGTGKDFARDAAAQATRMVDDYAAGWTAMHREACEATRLRGEQSEQVLSLRMMCLDRRLQELGALTGLFAHADAKVVEKAIDAAGALPSLRRCADVEALTARVSLPEHPQLRSQIDLVQRQLAQVKALHDAGRYREALELAERSAGDAERLGWAPLLAEARVFEGWLFDKTGDAKRAEPALEAGLRAAEAGRDDALKVTAATRLAYSVGWSQNQPERGHFWARMARAALDRAGGNDELETDLQTNLGSLYLLEGKTDQAQAAYERALALAGKALGENHPKRALILTSLGVAQTHRQDLAGARRTLEEALALIERTKGKHHPSTAYPHQNLGDLLRETKDYAGAHFHLQKAMAIWEASLGPEHPMVGGLLDRLGLLFHAEGRHAESLQHYQRALALKERALGPDHADLGYSALGAGQALLALRRPAEAVPVLERSLKLRSDTPGLAETRFLLAQALWQLGRDKERARSLAAQAKAGFLEAGATQEEAAVGQWLAQATR